MKVASVRQSRPAKREETSAVHDTFKGKVELKKYSREEYDSMSILQQQQLYELWKKARLIRDKKTPESSRALEARVAVLEAKTDNSIFIDKKPKANNRNNPALVRKESRSR